MVFTKKAGAKTTDYVVLAAQLQRMFPGKKWYLMTHDDSYIFAHNLLCELAEKVRSNDWGKECSWAVAIVNPRATSDCILCTLFFPGGQGDDIYRCYSL